MASAKMQYVSYGKFRSLRAKRQSGQSLLIALAILFLLGFLGALFSAIVIRNLRNAGTANDTITTDYFAQAGINYANTMLQNSTLGADWRPPLQYVDSVDNYQVNGAQTAATSALLAVPTQDPDYKWLIDGYTRYNMNGGRFLLKITYDPNNSAATPGATAATSKYLRIDSVGRLGTINAQDPTSFTSTPPDYRRTELYAYKPIGIVDYSRFITNKDNRTDTATLGMPSIVASATGGSTVVTPGVLDIDPTRTPTADPYVPTEYPLVTTYGSATAYNGLFSSKPTTAVPGGGSLRSNMNLRLYGINDIYLDPTYGDDWEIAGNLTFDGYNALNANNNTPTVVPATYATLLPAQAYLWTPAVTDAALFPSNDANFSTEAGIIRDGSLVSDSAGYPRQIKRLNPPVIDSVDSATGLTRYQTLTASGEVVAQQRTSTSDFTPATVNIDNESDIQHESTNQIGLAAHTLRNDWLNPGTSDTGGSWEGSFYNPPGALITFGPINGITGNPYGVTMTRSDVDSSNTPVQWTSPSTTAPTTYQQVGQTLLLPYYKPFGATAANPNTSAQGYLDADAPNAADPPLDIVIHASGNIRVRGIISDPNKGDPGYAPQHITIVTDGIAYIDGSILKGNPNSSIAILAKQYVCVNTTQFLAGAPDLDSSVAGVTADPGTLGPPAAPADLRFNNAEVLNEQTLYGPTTTGTYNYALYVEQSEDGINAQSEGLVNGDQLATVTGTTPVRDVANLTAPTSLPDVTIPAPGDPITLSFSKSNQYTADWLLQKAAILPGDIAIQAVIYAQDSSFFVIPGDWFNSDATDTLTHAFDRAITNPATRDTRYPFYGQPIDLQITIDGAVAENIPADISDQSAWFQKWGWIPRYHGSDLTEISPHAPVPTTGPTAGLPSLGIGLNFSYDPMAGFPYTFSASGAVTYLRQDRYGRPLPFAPALPVSPDLLYSGQPQAL
jgi:hypothetical protein